MAEQAVLPGLPIVQRQEREQLQLHLHQNTSQQQQSQPLEQQHIGPHVDAANDTSTGSGRAGGEKPRRKIISAACESCRKKKTRCNGVRPTCSACLNRGSQCVYDVEAGETRVQSLKSKNQTLEQSLNSILDACCQLQSDSQEDVLAAVDFIRNNPQFRATMSAGMRSLGREYVAPEDRVSYVATRKVPPTYSDACDVNVQHATNNGVYDVRQKSKPSAIPPEALVELPDEHIALEALSDFYRCSGKLFHAFPKDMGLAIVHEVYRAGGHTSPVKLAQMFSIIAMGCQYASDAESAALGARSYHIAKSFLEIALEEDSLQATRIIACLALHNMMSKSTVALAYIEQSLGIFSRYGLDQAVQPANMSRELWCEMKPVWRTHIFLESWLAATLGYVSATAGGKHGDGLLADIALHKQPASTELFIEAALAEMTRVSVLTARTVQVLSKTSCDAKSVDALANDLQSWFGKIHPDIKLERLLEMDIHAEATVPCYFIHLVYHGGVMLIYRCILSYVADLKDVSLAGAEYLQRVTMYEAQGLDAARSSARIMRILLDANVINKRCWLAIFHSYTPAIIILNFCVQKILHQQTDSNMRKDLDAVYHCIRVLAFAAEVDPVAAQFFITIIPFYDFVISYLGEVTLPLASHFLPLGRRMEADVSIKHANIQSLGETLLDVVSKPFGEVMQVRQESPDPIMQCIKSQLSQASNTLPQAPSQTAEQTASLPRMTPSVAVLDAPDPPSRKSPVDKLHARLSLGLPKQDLTSPSNWSCASQTTESSNPTSHSSEPPPIAAEETSLAEPSRASNVHDLLKSQPPSHRFTSPQFRSPLGWSPLRETPHRPLGSPTNEFPPYSGTHAVTGHLGPGGRSYLHADNVPLFWASKKRRFDHDPMDSSSSLHSPGAPHSRRPSGGGDSGYTSASRGYGSVSSTDKGSFSDGGGGAARRASGAGSSFFGESPLLRPDSVPSVDSGGAGRDSIGSGVMSHQNQYQQHPVGKGDGMLPPPSTMVRRTGRDSLTADSS